MEPAWWKSILHGCQWTFYVPDPCIVQQQGQWLNTKLEKQSQILYCQIQVHTEAIYVGRVLFQETQLLLKGVIDSIRWQRVSFLQDSFGGYDFIKIKFFKKI